MQLSIFWRLVMTSLVIITVMGGVNIYALFQLAAVDDDEYPDGVVSLSGCGIREEAAGFALCPIEQ